MVDPQSLGAASTLVFYSEGVTSWDAQMQNAGNAFVFEPFAETSTDPQMQNVGNALVVYPFAETASVRGGSATEPQRQKHTKTVSFFTI